MTPALFVMPTRFNLPLNGNRTFQEISELITPMIEDMGFELVQSRMIGGARKTLQIMVEPQDHELAMTLDQCAEVSHALSALLDVADPISGAYSLEVSSPGIDRPLVRLADYERFSGFEARVETAQPIDGQRKFRGRLLGNDGETVRIEVEGCPRAIAFAAIQKGKLVLSDELIKSHQQAAEARAEAAAKQDEGV